ncbi:uncharacterized protein LOC119300142 [Triticum dicoccoides]|uniref:uncharacterized protein LOC119300142 n=1 Tax=Triticum dicoccoides TaxID=85692 RepID=UPI000E7A921D|nr:uncharacterized protein LOC119300142 [Triticum dicoccoides]
MGVHPGLRQQLVAKQLESPDFRRSTIDGQTSAPTLLITVVVDSAFRARSVVQWHGFCQGPPTGTLPAGCIDDVTSTYYYYVADRACSERDCTEKFTGVQGGEAGRTAGGCARHETNDHVHPSGQGPYACPEAQLMANCPVIRLNEDSAVERLLRWSAVTLEAAGCWVAGICGGRDHVLYACPESQLMADGFGG